MINKGLSVVDPPLWMKIAVYAMAFIIVAIVVFYIIGVIFLICS